MIPVIEGFHNTFFGLSHFPEKIWCDKCDIGVSKKMDEMPCRGFYCIFIYYLIVSQFTRPLSHCLVPK